MKFKGLFGGPRMVAVEAEGCAVWTLENTVSVPWTPRSECLVQQEKATDSEPDDVTLMQVIVPALIPFPEAKRAVTEALARFLGPYEGGRGDGP